MAPARKSMRLRRVLRSWRFRDLSAIWYSRRYILYYHKYYNRIGMGRAYEKHIAKRAQIGRTPSRCYCIDARTVCIALVCIGWCRIRLDMKTLNHCRWPNTLDMNYLGSSPLFIFIIAFALVENVTTSSVITQYFLNMMDSPTNNTLPRFLLDQLFTFLPIPGIKTPTLILKQHLVPLNKCISIP